MNNPAIEAFTQQLAAAPDDWHLRAHLATLMEQSGDRHGAAQIIMAAPSMPQAREHALTAVRILTPVNPAASLPYLQQLGQAGSPAIRPMAPPPGYPAGAPPSLMASPPPMAAPAQNMPGAAELPGGFAPPVPSLHPTGAPTGGGYDHPHPPIPHDAPHHPYEFPPEYNHGHEVYEGEIHLTHRPTPKFGTGRFVTVVVAHVIALVLAGFWVIAQIRAKEKDKLTFEATPPRPSAVKGTDLAVKMAKKKSSSSAPAAAKRISVANAASRVSIPAIQVTSNLTDTNFSSSGMGGSGMGFGFGGTGGNGTGGTGMGGSRGRFMGALNMDSRCSKGDRDKRITESGGNPAEVEAAVKKALDYFKAKQNPDGSWGAGFKPAMTGLVLLSYFGHCETPDNSKDYADTVMKGLTYLIDVQMKKGFMASGDKAAQNTPYEHGIASYALGEGYTMTRYGAKKIPNLADALKGAIEVIAEGQDGEGGWNYGYGPIQGAGSDLSVSGWQIQALNAAAHAQMNELRDKIGDTMKKAGGYLKASQDRQEGFKGQAFGYRGKSGLRYSMTGVGVLCTIVTGKESSSERRDGEEYIRDVWDKRKFEFDYGDKEADLYASYYVNQVAFMKGGKMWRDWNQSVQKSLIPSQNPDGSYKVEGSEAAAHPTAGVGPSADIYRTALCTLMLEVYYRYLPSTEKHKGSRDE